jgi:hypothetical protein
MAEQQDRPLWELMHEAYWRVAGCNGFNPPASPDCYAAEIRAIADVVAPDRPQPSTLELCYDEDDEREWHYEQRIRALLLAEAERAEKGEANG